MSRAKLANERWPKSWVNEKDGGWQDILIKVITDDDTFHLGQVYENKAAESIECNICGGREFNVGQGSYFTAIRCVKCEWEECIHDG